MRWLFEKKYTRLDTYMIGVTAVLFANQEWLIAGILLVIGGLFCAVFEGRYR